MNVVGEDAFWETLSGPDVDDNTAGVPPYDVDEVTELILGVCDNRGCLLDLGCGTGRLTNHIANRLGSREHIHGLDISRNLIDRAVVAAPDNAHYWHGNGRRFPHGLNAVRFTGAYSVAMFQHIPFDAMWGYLHQVHDSLQPGAPFLFTIAVGDTDMFLNHQIPDPRIFAVDLLTIFDNVDVSVVDERGWTWVSTWKAE